MTNNIDLVNSIIEYNGEHEDSLTNVIVSAPWLSKYDMEQLIKGFPEIQFVIESHSNVGFLQADPLGMKNILSALELSEIYDNIKVGGNSLRFVRWMRKVYGQRIVYLPNLYPLSKIRKDAWDGISTIKIGIFGAIRPLKNFMTAAGAAVAIHKELDVPIEIHMSAGGEGNGGDVTRSIDAMCGCLDGVELIKHGWQPWEEFIELVSQMDLLLQPSYTESFNMITADGIYCGVPSVVSSAIVWAPKSWKADSDDALDIARVGVKLLCNPNAIFDGIRAIERQNEEGVEHWLKYLGGEPLTFWQAAVKWIKELVY
ncbi:MAG: hypothetical protein OK457_07850 [Thaumarchaeota archaeon]|nr:hypothetical protein [Nitrososphaerota archaeon]